MEAMSFGVSILTFAMGMYLTMGEKVSEGSAVATTVFMVMINVIFLILCVFIVLKEMRRHGVLSKLKVAAGNMKVRERMARLKKSIVEKRLSYISNPKVKLNDSLPKKISAMKKPASDFTVSSDSLPSIPLGSIRTDKDDDHSQKGDNG